MTITYRSQNGNRVNYPAVTIKVDIITLVHYPAVAIKVGMITLVYYPAVAMKIDNTTITSSISCCCIKGRYNHIILKGKTLILKFLCLKMAYDIEIASSAIFHDLSPKDGSCKSHTY